MPTKETKALNIYRLEIATGRLTQLTKGKFDQSGVCAPDSKVVYYVTLVNGRQLLMRVPLAGGESQQLTDWPVNFAAVSPDGQQLAVLSSEGEGVQSHTVIKLMPSSGGAPFKKFDVHTAISGPMQYSGDGKALYYPITEKGVSNFVRQSLDGGTPVPATRFNDLFMSGYSYNWSNQKLAVTRGKTNTDIVLLSQQAAQ
jgi:hypothetical protein